MSDDRYEPWWRKGEYAKLNPSTKQVRDAFEAAHPAYTEEFTGE